MKRFEWRYGVAIAKGQVGQTEETKMKKSMWLSAAMVFVMGIAFVTQANAQLSGAYFWLKADAGVTTDGNGFVTTWEDQAGNNDAVAYQGNALLTTAVFPDGTLPVVRFDGDDALRVPTSIQLNTFSIYAVVTPLAGSSGDRAVLATAYDWSPYYGYSVRMMTPANLIFWSGDAVKVGGSYITTSWTRGSPQIITATLEGSEKNLYVDGDAAGPLAGGVSYIAASVTTIGAETRFTLGSEVRFYFQGDIAELIIYDSVSDEQRLQVEAYLNDKYMSPIPEPSTLVLIGLGVLPLLARKYRSAVSR